MAIVPTGLRLVLLKLTAGEANVVSEKALSEVLLDVRESEKYSK